MSPKAPGNFVSFPESGELLRKLRAMADHGEEHEPLFRQIAGRLAGKAYDRSAFVFILIELVYEHEDLAGGALTDLLPRAVLALTEDQELSQAALEAYGEIKAAIGPHEEAAEDAAAASPPAEVVAPDLAEILEEAFSIASDPIDPYVPRSRREDQERLMIELQEAQKQVVDQGLSARMSIDMTLSRPTPERVSHALREISALRATLRGFETLLSESQERILEQIGVLGKD